MAEINLKSKCWQFICYPDPDPDHDVIPNNHYSLDLVIDNLTASGCKFAFAYHDKDDNEPHYHFVCVWKSPRYMSGLQAITGHKHRLAYQMFDSSELNEKIKYLIHLNAPGKYQYDRSIISSDTFSSEQIDSFLYSDSFVPPSREESAMLMVEYAFAYIEHRATLADCVKQFPSIVHNVRNFLTLCDGLKAERFSSDYNEKPNYSSEFRSLFQSWADFNKGDN